MSDHRLENRYVVIKLSRLTDWQRNHLEKVLEDTGIDHCCVGSVVIEEDWPEYTPVCDMLFERINREASSD